MTRKARRKRLKEQARRSSAARWRAKSSPWLVAGAFVATTALAKTEVAAQTPASAAARVAPGSTAGDQPTFRFDIPGGPLGDVLAAFERTTGLRVEVAVDAIKAIYSRGVSGVFNNEQALDRIITDSSLSFRFQSASQVILEFRTGSASVDVTASAPSVASPKFTAPLRDIPQTINVIPSRLMDEQGATTLRDALRNVTGITFQAGEGGTPAGDQMTIRGFSARTDMFIDGIRDTGGYARDTFNLEQVEVAKGPSSAVAGRGSTGGSINLVSKTPGMDARRSATIEGGTADFKRGTLDVNQPLDGLRGAAVRLNAMFTDGGVPRRDVVRHRSWAVAPSVGVGLTSPTRVTLSYLHLGQDNLPDYGLPWVPAANVPLAAYANGQSPAEPSNFYGLVARDFERVNNDVLTGQIEHDFAPTLRLRNVTRYGSTLRDSVITSPRFATNTSTDIRRTDVKWRDQDDTIAANATNLTGKWKTGRWQHDVVSGLEFGREMSRNNAGAEFGALSPTSPDTDLYHPNPYDTYAGQMKPTGAYTDGVANSTALYAFDTLKPHDKWQLTGGLRWDRFDVDYNSVAANGVGIPLSRTDRMVSWRAGSVYKPEPTGSIYLGYATSFNPSAEGLALATSTVNLEPEKTRTLEGGTKWDVRNERVSLNAGVFRTEKTNARTSGINPGDPPTVLAGRQVVTGVELGVSGSFTRRWSGVMNYSFMHSDIPQSNTPAEVDQALQFTPESTFYLWTTYDLRPGLKVGGGVQYMDSVFRNQSNTTNVPSYWLANALVSYDVNDHLTLRVNANNLGDAVYVDRISGGHYVPGPGRLVLVSTNVKF